MSYEIWTGTPHEMVCATTPKTTLPAAVKWAREHLGEMEQLAEKFDHRSLDSIRSTREQMTQVWRIAEGERRGWQFDYVGLTFRIEIRRVK
jgi:hypothetical protein